jgi:uncharacterized protein (DUF983 family)
MTLEIQNERRDWKRSVWRGFHVKCPQCGEGRLLSGYIGTAPKCTNCGQDLQGHRADDAPPYFTMMIVGHVIVPLLLLAEKFWQPALWVHFVIWLPATLLMTLWLLPRVKGATIGLQWAFRMHGFAAKAPGDGP